jgi:hypothetical protein
MADGKRKQIFFLISI